VPVNPIALAIVESCTFVARSSAVVPEHLQKMMVAAIRHRGFALLDILQPCVTFNRVNTWMWYKQRVRELPADYDPTDRALALETAFKWGEEIPIGIIYRCERKTFEEQQPALAKGPLAMNYGK
jgi:2-oxoglutarate ferredoxin oxidoreductase subunit beta